MAELDGSVFDWPIAAFRIIPYFARTKLALPPLDTLIDISQKRLAQMENSTYEDPEEENDDIPNDLSLLNKHD